MFTDGVLYAAVAHNMAKGLGSFWYPHFDNVMYPFFHQQPPLTFAIEALFYKLFGDSLYVERFYSFLTLIISAWLISILWRTICADKLEIKKMSWLPIVLWIIIPVCSWSYANNLEENTMGIFSLLSVLFIYKGLQRNKLLLLFAGGLFCSLAFLCKGFPGMFAISLPFFYWLVIRNNSFIKMVLQSIIVLSSISVFFGFILINKVALNSLQAYLHDRVINSILHVATESNRLYLLFKLLFVELLPVYALTGIIIALLKRKSLFVVNDFKKNKGAFLFLLLGLSASIPLIITKEQREFYLVTSFPYFAIAFSIVVCNGLFELVQRISVNSKGFKVFKVLSGALLITSIGYSVFMIGATGRDKEKLHDIYVMGKVIPEGITAGTFPETWDDWSLHNYLIRYYNISLDCDTGRKYTYFIVERNLQKLRPAKFEKINLSTEQYDLYKVGEK